MEHLKRQDKKILFAFVSNYLHVYCVLHKETGLCQYGDEVFQYLVAAYEH